jgi:hypothetical protein
MQAVATDTICLGDDDFFVDQAPADDFVGLRDDVFKFIVGREILDFFGNRSVRKNFTVRRLDESVFVDSSIRGKVGNQSDIRTFRRFDRTDATIMGRMDVADFIAGTFPCQATRA